ncbi:hypothetical protein K435DRAFT_82522 [Dendrothele bispora CBS 962.96]|uniref:Uncharacterized protein n=1 Tax=Dendrothele bispora (strain CBS 962.96) TaxID=1314807 RepID=A0A4S8M4E9_DENBC|nr:hypothetical protein K435DRAFT_82522 [Dendrothele bispora CBS 962.96]
MVYDAASLLSHATQIVYRALYYLYTSYPLSMFSNRLVMYSVIIIIKLYTYHRV